MSPAERWTRLKAIVAGALDVSGEERAAFVDEACARWPELRADMDRLLEAASAAGAFIDVPYAARPVESEHASQEPTDPAVGPDARLGPYRIVREIGRGGMGVVYLAERADATFERQVAIKVVAGLLARPHLMARFAVERKILAGLEHPNIARLLDAGATGEGLPYVVMEYVDGRPIEEYCRVTNAPVRRRLEMFCRICDAVQYAHQRLIVHRDLKSGNILVTDDGEPKLLDFGIAKLLGDAALTDDARTATGQRLLTPAYASPEQIRGDAITTAVDVYALGVLLYHLLTGHSPYRVTTSLPHEVARAICEQDPEPPSRVARPASLDADLDTIVLKALQKDPERRYTSVLQFAEDIQRHLDSRPVLARRDSATYRIRKFAARHRLGVAVAGLAVTAMLAGIWAIAWQARIAQVERERAERRFGEVRTLANSFLFQFHDAIENLSGSTPARVLVVDTALQYLERLEQDSEGDRSLQRELAAAYERLGNVQGRPVFASLGRTSDAEASYRKALRIRERLVADDPGDRDSRRGLESIHLALGRVEARRGNTDAGLGHFRQAIAFGEALVLTGADAAAESGLATAYTYVGDALSRRGDAAGARQEYLRALAINERRRDAEPDAVRVLTNLSADYDSLGYLAMRTGNVDEALDFYTKALAIDEHLAAKDETNFVYRRALALTYARLGEVSVRRRELAGGLTFQQRSLALREVSYRVDPANAQTIRDLAVIHTFIAETFDQMDQPAEALSHFRRSLEFAELRGRSDPAGVQPLVDIGTASRGIGRALTRLGRTTDATPFHRRAVTIFEDVAARDVSNTEWQSELALAYGATGALHEALTSSTGARDQNLRHWTEARTSYGRALDIWRRMEAAGTLAGGTLGGFEPRALREMTERVEQAEAAVARLTAPGTARKPGR